MLSRLRLLETYSTLYIENSNKKEAHLMSCRALFYPLLSYYTLLHVSTRVTIIGLQHITKKKFHEVVMNGERWSLASDVTQQDPKPGWVGRTSTSLTGEIR